MISAAAATILPAKMTASASPQRYSGNTKDNAKQTINSPLVPENAGRGDHRRNVQNKTLARWSALSMVGLSAFYQQRIELSPGARAAVLGVLFPGAGFIACANWIGAALGLLTILLLPVTLFAVCLVAVPLSSI